jgi:hypothetical protein
MDGEDELIEFLTFNSQLLATGGGQRVVAGAPIVLRGAPFSFHPAPQEEPLQSRIEGTLPGIVKK